MAHTFETQPPVAEAGGNPDFIIRWSPGIYQRAYTVVFPVFGDKLRDYDTLEVAAADIESRLGVGWRAVNRVLGLEIHSTPYGQQANQLIVETIKHYIDELRQLNPEENS